MRNLIGRAVLGALMAAIVMGAVAPAKAYSQAAQSPEKKEISDYKLTTDKLNKFEVAAKSYTKLANGNPALQASLNKDAQAAEQNTVANSVKSIEKHPELVSAIKSAGFTTTREYVVMTYALINTFSNVGMKRKGFIKQLPTSISVENAVFVDQNYDRVNGIVNMLTPKDEGDK